MASRRTSEPEAATELLRSQYPAAGNRAGRVNLNLEIHCSLDNRFDEHALNDPVQKTVLFAYCNRQAGV